MIKKIIQAIAYLIVMFTLGFGIYYFLLQPNSLLKSSFGNYTQLSTSTLFAAKLPNENNVQQVLKQYQGKIIVLNFWATWCGPCRDEMPELSQLHTENLNKDVVVLGIGIDTVDLIKDFTLETPVSYPLFAAEDEGMAIALALGNDRGVLPYTVIIDRRGNVVKTYFGRINKALLESTVKPLFL
ncbi:MAG: redoxin [Methylotenera sp.]|nr:MAG: redoxin [Methylotenera sp.]